MKIIRPGDLEKAKYNKEQPKKFECPDCECIFEATNEEYTYEGCIKCEDTYICECPTCHEKVYMYE